MPTWTKEQDGALVAVNEWFNSSRRKTPFYLAGYAGTGKTTLAKYFAENVDGTVIFCAFTGKAVSVLREKGCRNAATLHSTIYRPVGQTNAKTIKELKQKIEDADEETHENTLKNWKNELADLQKKSRAMFELREQDDAPAIKGADLVILDECSMIDVQMRKDIESFGVPVLVLGDPGQLPPVGGKGGWADDKPDYVLEEIHRQAQESNILRLAHDIRKGIWNGYMQTEDCVVARRDDWNWETAVAADQVLTGKNATRHNLNKGIRKRLGFDKLFPLKGEKLICLKNDHEEGLLNGVTCYTKEDTQRVGQSLSASINYEGEEKLYYIDPGHFEENYFARRQSHPSWDAVQHFDYGYAITGHKSQGSQWKNVVICDDKMNFADKSMRKKWLYTVVTRAEEKVTLYI